MTAKTSTTKPPTARKAPRKRQSTAPQEATDQGSPPKPQPVTALSHPAVELITYQLDLWQRGVRYLDTLRERAEAQPARIRYQGGPQAVD